jgi:hypothetical protein
MQTAQVQVVHTEELEGMAQQELLQHLASILYRILIFQKDQQYLKVHQVEEGTQLQVDLEVELFGCLQLEILL